MKSDSQVELEFSIQQRDKIILALAEECRFLRSVFRGVFRRGVADERVRLQVPPLSARLTKAQRMVLHALTRD